MMNLISSATNHADSSVVDAVSGGGGSPLGAKESGPDGKSGVSGGRRVFGAMFASAFGEAGGARVATSGGKGLPVPVLQEREVGEGIRLITAGEADRPGEDALFAFAVSQGLDASLVASVLWPGFFGAGSASGLTKVSAGLEGKGAGESEGVQTPSAEILAMLLASVNARPASQAPAVGSGSPASPGAADLSAPTTDGSVPGAVAGLSGTGGALGVNAFGLAGTAAGSAGAAELPAISSAGPVVAGLAGLGPNVTEQAPSAGNVFSSLNVGDAAPLTAVLPGSTASSGLPRTDPSMAFFAAPSAAATSAASAPASGPIAAPIIQALANRTSDLKFQIKATSENSLASTPAPVGQSASVTGSFPAQWVLMGAGYAGVGMTRDNSPGQTAIESQNEDAADVGLELDGGGAVTGSETGHRHHAAKTGVNPADPIDLSLEAQRSADGARLDGEEGLARRFAESVAQRMLAAVAGNSWKLQIDLKPAHLGHVSIEMSMHQGRLEAVFDAGQTATRSLISEGLDRLRQDLQRAGMNVAHLGLNFGGGTGSGGKSTPRGREEEQSAEAGSQSVQDIAPVTTVSRSRVGPDGLDVTV